MMPNHPQGFVAADHCEFCRIYATSAKYRTVVDQKQISTAKRDVDRVECIHRRVELRSAEAAARGLSALRAWIVCAAGHADVAGAVCLCNCSAERCVDFQGLNAPEGGEPGQD